MTVSHTKSHYEKLYELPIWLISSNKNIAWISNDGKYVGLKTNDKSNIGSSFNIKIEKNTYKLSVILSFDEDDDEKGIKIFAVNEAKTVFISLERLMYISMDNFGILDYENILQNTSNLKMLEISKNDEKTDKKLKSSKKWLVTLVSLVIALFIGYVNFTVINNNDGLTTVISSSVTRIRYLPDYDVLVKEKEIVNPNSVIFSKTDKNDNVDVNEKIGVKKKAIIELESSIKNASEGANEKSKLLSIFGPTTSKAEKTRVESEKLIFINQVSEYKQKIKILDQEIKDLNKYKNDSKTFTKTAGCDCIVYQIDGDYILLVPLVSNKTIVEISYPKAYDRIFYDGKIIEVIVDGIIYKGIFNGNSINPETRVGIDNSSFSNTRLSVGKITIDRDLKKEEIGKSVDVIVSKQYGQLFHTLLNHLSRFWSYLTS
jgi:hypothetical protein